MPECYDNQEDDDHDEYDAAERIPLQNLHGRASIDSTQSALDHLISADISLTSSIDLPPVDGGRRAWTCLLGCWLVEAMIWGFPLAFGVFQRYYSANELFKQSNNIPTIGTLATGMSCLGMPFANPIALRWPQHRGKMCLVGWLICLVGLLGASFATQVWHLVLFQGFLYGTGWVISYTPALFMLNEWFVEKRGLAYGILFGASGVTGLVIPNAMGWMLDRFGFRTALRVYVVATIVLSGPGLFLIRARTPSEHANGSVKNSEFSALKALRPLMTNTHFLIMAVAVSTQGLGFFIPNIFIPSFAEALGLSTSASSALLALVSLSQMLGQLWQGWISDRVDIYILISLSTLIPGLGALLLWGPAKSLAYLATFALIWGFFSASYSVLYTRMCTFLTTQARDGEASESVTMLLYGFFNFFRGIANILEGPISSWLLGDARVNIVDLDKFGLGRYAGVIWFTLLCMMASSISGIGWLLTHGKSKPARNSSG